MKPTLKTNTRSVSCIWCISWFLLCSVSFGQRNMVIQPSEPHIGYIYPAGAQRGTTATIIVGGQNLDKVDGIHISGGGVRAQVVGFDRLLDQNEVLRARRKMQEVREEMGLGEGRLGRSDMQAVMEAAGVTPEYMAKMLERNKMRRDPMIQENEQVADKVSIEIEVLPDAEPGRRELRVYCEGRISSPLAFYIGDHPEHTEADGKTVEQSLPVVLNGQIFPGEADRWTFTAKRGDPLVIASMARVLVPHLADAVPGWFQAVMALYDAEGHEVAYADDYRFNPDPALYYDIPADGTYTLEIRDSIYRGRQDFVYRITLGEIPFITSIFPLGGKEGTTTPVEIRGKNLPANAGSVGDQNRLDSIKGIPLAYPVPFAHSTLPELFEDESTNAMPIRSTCIINGKIDHPGDLDVFEIQLNQGETFLAEVNARRLNSPLDSILKITDAAGRQVALNDDHEDKSLGMMTHHADSRLTFKAPRSGTYHVHLGDAQNQGGREFAYRLHLGRPQPDYALRAVPSNLNGDPGESVPLTLYALRKDGFDQAIDLKLLNNIEGLRLDGARIPADQDSIELTVTLPSEPLYVVEPLQIEGRAVAAGKPLVRPAIPAEDMMQAFIYHHLVPAEELLLATAEQGRLARPGAKPRNQGIVKLRPGADQTVSFETSASLGRFRGKPRIEPRSLPAGVQIQNVSVVGGLIEITLSADASVKRELEGNLLFDQYLEVERQGRDEKTQTIRIEAGTLPAVPFRIL